MDGLKNIKEFIRKNKLDELGYNPIEYATNIIEEVVELLTDLDSQKAREVSNKIVMELVTKYNVNIDESKVESQIDAMCDIVVYSVDGIEKLGYDADKALLETGKEILSRRQDPEQKARWEKEGPRKGEKWKKDVNQPAEEKYKADYSKCKKLD